MTKTIAQMILNAEYDELRVMYEELHTDYAMNDNMDSLEVLSIIDEEMKKAGLYEIVCGWVF